MARPIQLIDAKLDIPRQPLDTTGSVLTGVLLLLLSTAILCGVCNGRN